MILDDLPNLEDFYTSLCSPTVEDSGMDFDSGLEDDDTKSDSILEDSIIFVAFKGNTDDKDSKWKLDNIEECAQFVIHGIQQEKVQKAAHWNSAGVTFDIHQGSKGTITDPGSEKEPAASEPGIFPLRLKGKVLSTWLWFRAEANMWEWMDLW